MYLRSLLNGLLWPIKGLCCQINTVHKAVRHKSLNAAWRRIKMDTSLPLSRADPIVIKIDSPEFQSVFTSELCFLIDLFKKYNYELKIAGGAVRDILMEKNPKDVDFATNATPDQMKEIFEKEQIRMLNTKGEKHGTVTVRINDKENFEVTTLRIDTATDGRHAEVEYTTNWKLDASRRDLTINSMFLDFDGNLYDYFYGYDDLKKKKVVFVGDATNRICEDYLRIFRYFRFYGRIKDNPDSHDENMIKAIKANIDGLQRISGNRIWSEWSKILEGKFGMEMTLKLLECGSNKYIGLPEKLDVENFKTVCQRAMSNCVILKPISMITSMLKDQSEVMNLYNRLKLPNFDRDLALFLIQHREYKPCEKPLRPYQHLIFTQQMQKYNVYREYINEILKYRGAMELLSEFKKWEIPKFPISGHILKEHVSEKAMIGLVINELKRIWINEDFKIAQEQLIEHVPHVLSKLKNKTK